MALISSIPKYRLRLIGLLFVSTLFTICLIAARIYVTQKVTFAFLIWNLILAAIPFVISTFMISFESKIKAAGLFLLLACWLVFFPNAPYILTDFFHLRQRPDVPLWFDLMVILSAAWNGLILGLLSLLDMQHIITKRFSKLTGWLFVTVSLFLCGFGIYIGRYLRWNSWDIVTNPVALGYDLIERIADPVLHPRTLGVTVLYMLFLFIVFAFFRLLMTGQNKNAVESK